MGLLHLINRYRKQKRLSIHGSVPGLTPSRYHAGARPASAASGWPSGAAGHGYNPRSAGYADGSSQYVAVPAWFVGMASTLFSIAKSIT